MAKSTGSDGVSATQKGRMSSSEEWLSDTVPIWRSFALDFAQIGDHRVTESGKNIDMS